MSANPISSSLGLALPVRRAMLAAVMLLSATAPADEVVWTGDESTNWFETNNWSGGVPGLGDIVRIPATAYQPVIGGGAAYCGGMILEASASVTVLAPSNTMELPALYVVGSGDLDGDGFSDAYELEYSLARDEMDADRDDIPNYAETDSDNDGLSDACEYQYGPDINNRFNPLWPDDLTGPGGEANGRNADGDEYTDFEECAAGMNPTVAEIDLPASGIVGMIIAGLAVAAAAVLVLRKAGPRGRRAVGLVLAVGLSGALLWALGSEERGLNAETFDVDFAVGHTLEGRAAAAGVNDTLEIQGISDRPWNGASTYLTKPLTVTAVDGPVFLGGMRSALKVGLLGDGSASAVSLSLPLAVHPAPVSSQVNVGTAAVPCFLGERLDLSVVAAAGWRFAGWKAGAVFFPGNPKIFQVVDGTERVIAWFGPPGPDLAALEIAITVPSDKSTVKAGAAVSLAFKAGNIGLEAVAPGGWEDRVYLSRDAALDPGDLVLDTEARAGALSSGGSYTVAVSFSMPDVAPGSYYFLGAADVDTGSGTVTNDSNRSNNTAAVSITVLDVNLAQ